MLMQTCESDWIRSYLLHLGLLVYQLRIPGQLQINIARVDLAGPRNASSIHLVPILEEVCD